MPQRFVVGAAAWLEIIVGSLFLIVPDVMCLLLFGARLEAIGMLLGRFAGIGLLALGIACLPSRDSESPRNIVWGLFTFNAGVAILFAWVGVAGALHGFLLWPAVILHTVIAGALLPQLLAKGSVSRDPDRPVTDRGRT
jgi:hypothetical protein